MASQVGRLSLVTCQDCGSAIGPAPDAPAPDAPARDVPARDAGARGKRGPWIDRFCTNSVCFPDFDETATTRDLRCSLALFHRFAEHLVTLAEGSPRRDLLAELDLAGQDICALLDDFGTVASAIVVRIIASLEYLLDEAFADPAKGRSAVLASPWLVLGLFDGFSAVASDMLRAVTQRDRRVRRTPATLRHDRMNKQVARHFLDRLTALYGAFAVAAAIPLPAGQGSHRWPPVDAIAPDITAIHAHLGEGLRLVATRLGQATERQEIADLTAAITSIAGQIALLERNGEHAAPSAAVGVAMALQNILETAPKRARGELCNFLGQVEHFLDTLGTECEPARKKGSDSLSVQCG